EEERHQTLVEFNDTAVAYPQGETVIDLFAQSARSEIPAIVDGEDVLSYNAVDQAADRLALYLIDRGVSRGDVVAVCLERSAELIVSLLAILKAGAAYLPLSPDDPPDRLGFMLTDADSRRILTTAAQVDRLSVAGSKDHCDLIVLDDPVVQEDLGARCPEADATKMLLVTRPRPRDVAYVLYTSGSTGRPKGVVVRHESLMNRLRWMQQHHSIGAGDAILQKTPTTFDVSVWELLWWAVTGARVVMLEPGAHKDPAAVAEAICRYDVTVVHFVPSMLEAFVQHWADHPEALRNSRLEQVYASGEALPAPLVRRFHTLARSAGRMLLLTNLYGPTEATIDVTYYDTTGDEDNIPIG
ncbi:MAG: AMP-binding protein, partial [Hyphomicrobiales bacterium]|nr:AMP-binding protein [Hyphomicrobiales bacterium]